MRVLFVINSLGAGGAELSLLEILRSAPRSAMNGVVGCLVARSEGVQDQARNLGIDIRFIDAQGWTGRIGELRRLVAQTQPDLIHTTLFEADVVGRIAAVRSTIPVLTSLVNTSYAPVRGSDPAVRQWKLRAVKAVDGWTARHLTTHFHAITQAVRRAAVRDLKIDPLKVTVIERGRDPQRLGLPSRERRARARGELGLDGSFTILTVGRQEFQKGQWHLLEAMPRLLADIPDARLLLAGRRGNVSTRLEDTVREADLDGHAWFLGHREDVPELLAASDLFVFPSLYEGLGGALIEAMALGLPIVASDLPAIREVVEDGRNAVLVPAGSPPALARAMTDLAVDPERRARMGERSRQIFLERFTLERSARRMVELFERVAAEGRHPRG